LFNFLIQEERLDVLPHFHEILMWSLTISRLWSWSMS